jgi:NhaP-type Na+/H+ or K+/H+ antiporter
MKVRWIVLAAAGAVVAVTWLGLALAYFFFEPSLPVWTGLVTAAAISLEGFFWVAAGVLGWSFLAGRRAMLERLRRRFFGG